MLDSIIYSARTEASSNGHEDHAHTGIGCLPAELITAIISYVAGSVVVASCDTHWDDDRKVEVWTPKVEGIEAGKHELASIVLPKISSFDLLAEFQRHIWRRCWKLYKSPMDLVGFNLAVHNSLDGFQMNKATQDSFSEASINLTKMPLVSSAYIYSGAEKMMLDFTSKEYFAAFNVNVPPFYDSTAWEFNPITRGSGTFVRNAKHLILRFGDAYDAVNPWWDVLHPRWLQEIPNDQGMPIAPRCRPGTCMKGVVADWILSYAWDQGFLATVPKIEIEGEIQPWVRQKWENIFKSKGEKGFVFHADINGIETIGLADVDPNQEWDPTEYYPPKCICKQNCSQLGKEGREPNDVGYDIPIDSHPTFNHDPSDEPEGIW